MRNIVILVVLSLALASPASAKKEKRGHTPKDTPAEAAMQFPAKEGAYGFSAHDKIMIQTYYRENAFRERYADGGMDTKKAAKHKPLPPGLQKKLERTGQLPPGWEKKLQRGDVISSDGYDYCQPIPPELSRRLPPPPPGSEMIRIEDRVFRIMRATREILDVLDIRF